MFQIKTPTLSHLKPADKVILVVSGAGLCMPLAASPGEVAALVLYHGTGLLAGIMNPIHV